MKAIIHYDDIPEDKYKMDGNYFIHLGSIDPAPSWEEYLKGFKKEYQPYILAIREAVKDADLLGIPANRIADTIWFECSDGIAIAFSWRAWGDLIQSIRNKQEGYMVFYYEQG